MVMVMDTEFNEFERESKQSGVYKREAGVATASHKWRAYLKVFVQHVSGFSNSVRAVSPNIQQIQRVTLLAYRCMPETACSCCCLLLQQTWHDSILLQVMTYRVRS
jgi:hypothetical protein